MNSTNVYWSVYQIITQVVCQLLELCKNIVYYLVSPWSVVCVGVVSFPDPPPVLKGGLGMRLVWVELGWDRCMGWGGGETQSAPTFLQKLHTRSIHVLIYTNLANMDLS